MRPKIKSWIRRILVSALAVSTATHAFAQTVVDFTKAENVGNSLIASLTGNIATIVFVLAVIVTGFLAAFNRIQWVWFFAVIFGAFLVFGAPAIVGALQGALS